MLTGKLVLLADADPETVEILMLVLEGEGALVTTVEGVLTAREKLIESAFDLAVIADELPDGSGAELVAFMRESGSDCVAVMITSEANRQTGKVLETAGLADYVHRPLPQVAVLRRRLSRALEMHSLGRKNRKLAADLKAKEELLAEVATHAEEEARRVAALERTIASADFDFVYQPIVSSSTGRIFGYEGLCRPRASAFPGPSALIQAAERCGCTAALGRALRQKGVEALSALPAGSLLFLNLHPSELLDPEFVAIEPFVAQWAGQVVFEITEVGAICDFEYVRQVIRRLRGSGFRVALDDLGAGYSGLRALVQLTPDFVKLDMHLVQAASRDLRMRKLLKHIAEFAAGEGMDVVAEGIETEEQRQVVVEIGCAFMQGYLFGRGQPLADIVTRQAETPVPLGRMRLCER